MAAGDRTGNPQTALQLEQLERDGNYTELASQLAALAHGAVGEERGALYARLAEARLRTEDIPGAIAALTESLAADPHQATSRRWLEVLLAEPDHALEAAALLEPLYEQECRSVPHAASMLLAILELKANRSPDHDERIATWVKLARVFDIAAAPVDRLREVAVRLLARTALEWPVGVAQWIDRVLRFVPEPEQQLDALSSALNQPLTDAVTVFELALATGHVLDVLGRGEEARQVYERALIADPTSPEVLGRIDQFAANAGEAPEPRAARFRAGISQAQDPERRAALRVAFGLLQKNVLDDLESARSTLSEAIAEAPRSFRAHEALLEVYASLQDDAAVVQELERGLTLFSGHQRRHTLHRLAEHLLSRGQALIALQRARALLDETEIEEAALDFLERLAEEVSDLEVAQRVHERRVELAADEPGQLRALELLAEFMERRAGDAPAAAAAWKRAAELALVSGAALADAERFYHRAVTAWPGDAEAARRLLELCAQDDDWQNLPNAIRGLLEAGGDPLGAVDFVLGLEPRATQLGVADEFASIADDVVSRLEDDREVETRALVSAKARVMASADRFDEAAHVYEALIESFADERDVRAFVDLVETNKNLDWRHTKRSWLFEWRAGRAEDPIAVLTHWARVEEQEFGDVPAALALLERARGLDPKRPEIYREMARLKLDGDNASGALQALVDLRASLPPGQATGEELKMAELLVERLGRPLEALPLLREVLRAQPANAQARAMALELCRLPGGLDATELIEAASSTADSAEEQRQTLQSLLSATAQRRADADGAAELPALRRRWFERLLALESGAGALAVFEDAAAEFPEDEAIWKAAESAAVRSGQPEAAVRAYEAALTRTEDGALAEVLGRRLVAFAEEYVGSLRALTPSLERMLTLAPTARWAFQRVKLALTNEQRWDALFALYDRAIAAPSDAAERVALLDEAAVAARDLAGDPERAIGYWESYFAERPEDARVDLALERLYERQQRSEALIAHLTRREPRLEEHDLVRLRERVAGLWLDTGNPGRALAAIESLPAAAETAESTLSLLERVFAACGADEQKVARRAAGLLKKRYRSLERAAEVAAVLVKELVNIEERKERCQLLAELAELRRGLGEEALEFETLGELTLLEPEKAAWRARLAELTEKLGNPARLAELLVLAADRVREQPLFAELLSQGANISLELGQREEACDLLGRILADASEVEARLSAARQLEQLLREARRPAERASVLERLAELSSEEAEQRATLLEAARVALEELGDAERAVAAHRRLLERTPDDVTLLDGLLRALRAGERWADVVTALARRAELDPDRARARDSLGEAARLRAERLGDVPGAIEAWTAIRGRFGRDAESFNELAQLYENAARYAELAALLAEEAEHAAAPAELYARLAEVHRHHTLDLPAALRAYLNAGILVAAAELFCATPELVSDDPALALELAGRLTAARSDEVAERVLRRQIDYYGPRRPKDCVAVHLALAELLVGAGQARRALAELIAAADRYPENERVLSKLGELAYSESELERAEQAYRALLLVLGRSPESEQVVRSRAEVYLAMSQIAAKRGDAARAEDHIASAFEAALASEEEALALEAALHRSGRGDLAERAITARLERARDPGRVAGALRDLVTLSSRAEPMDPALVERALRVADRSLRELESAGGSTTGAFRALLEVFERLDQKERALAVLEVLAKRATSEAERLEYEAAIAARLLALPGRKDDALAHLWTIVRKDAALDEPYQLLQGLVAGGSDFARLLDVLETQAAAAKAARESQRFCALSRRRAAALEQAGQLREALEVERVLAEYEPERLRALNKIVDLEERLGAQGTELAASIEALLAVETDAARAASLALRLVELRKQEWDDEGVERALELGFQRAPMRAELAEPLVFRLLERGAFARAIEVLERRIQAAPQDPELRLRLADALSRAKLPERALQALEAALAAGAAEASVRRERARILEEVGRTEEALAELETAVNLGAGATEELLAAIERSGAMLRSERWALRAADLFAEAGQRGRARKVLEPWAERQPNSSPLLTRIGRWATIDKDYSAALAAYRALSRIEQGNARRSAVLSLARVAEAAGRADEAVSEVEAALADGLESVELRRELGRLYARTGARLKYGRSLLEEAKAAKPGAQLELFSKAAELLAAEGATDEALAALEQVQKLDPERSDVALITATVLAAAGRQVEARATLQQALAAYEKRRAKPPAKLFQKLAELSLAEDDWLEAFEALSQAHQLDKTDSEIALLLGLLAADLDRGDVAFNALRAFITLKDKSVDTPSRRQLSRAYTQLGELELGKGQRTVARRMATRAVETDPDNKSAQRLLSDLGQR